MEAEILLWIQNHLRCGILNDLMISITHFGDFGLIWIILTILFLISPKTRKAGFACAIALLLSLFFNNLFLKKVVARTRPYEVIDNLKLLISKAVDYSFPSGHSASSFASATVINAYFPKRYGIFAFIFALLIAFSRLYVGIHYPSDVLVGILDGIILGWFSVLLEKKMENIGIYKMKI